jgi:hypothetical protein
MNEAGQAVSVKRAAATRTTQADKLSGHPTFEAV